MRLLKRKRDDIRRKILTDLFGSMETELVARKHELANKNRLIELEPYMELIKQLPAELVAHNNWYYVRVRYNMEAELYEDRLDETWSYYTARDTDKFISPVNLDSSNYTATLHPSLHEEAAKLAEDIITYTKEKKAMHAFLNATLGKLSSVNTIKKAWPESLHKYLPVPVVTSATLKVAQNKKDVVIPDVSDLVQERMTKNLLEGR